ncbi:DegQ family serine endoprotease [Niveibacterium umoris]|uniref:Probable periplasmic serine endoprotease DegP-like n=1 Tax=Niveibacterium umoris TaxID=1193620 RepID=A0A840BH24_9RHOO|nr:DegQ family serine endoprotease [Niveibacterium umoris]MBB4010902.1 serine protease Do [Niveibacterium umoris]
MSVRTNVFGMLLCQLVLALGVWSGSVAARDLPELADLVDRSAPAVVNVSTEQIRTRGKRADSDAKDPMQEWFRRFMPKHPRIPRDEDEGDSMGSGFIISADGYILTNAHVVEDADSILVRLTDKREFRGRLIGADKRSDVALIKIDAVGLPRVPVGDSSKLRVGDWVMAIGSPFGFDHTVTAGIVSAKGRSLPDESLVPFIQTDVAINPGNSGGPLFNLKGEVVGINSQIYSETGGFMGLSFAIPIEVAMDVQNQLRTFGRVTRGRIGVVIQEVTKDVADSFALKSPVGALVSSVEKGGPAERAGVAIGDVILKFDNKPVATSSDLPRLVGATRPGSRSSMQVWRRGAVKDVALVVEEFADEAPEPRRVPPKRVEGAGTNRLGLVVAQLSSEQRRHYRGEIGVSVKDVRGVAARAQLQGGDVILSAARKGAPVEFRNVEQFNRFAASIEQGESVSLLVRRGDTQSFVSLRVPE